MFFRDLVGQDRVLGFLRQALGCGQLPHALLFTGPAGVGKASTAQALAQTLNCLDRRPDLDACGRCRSCRLFAAGHHPDFLEIRPAGEGVNAQIKIEQIRELRRQTGFPPFAGRWRVVLLKPAEAMNEAAANALLKTLEEPPANHLFVLTATDARDLLPTIVSRCRRLVFNPLPQSVVVQQLQARRGLTPEAAALVAAIHGGSLGPALEEDLAALLAARHQMLADLEVLQSGSVDQVLEWAALWAKKGVELERFLLLAQIWYRDLLVLAHQGPPAMLMNQDCFTALQQEHTRWPRSVILRRLNLLQTLQWQLRTNANVELALNALAVHWRQSAPGSTAPPPRRPEPPSRLQPPAG